MSSTNRGGQRRESDFYETPSWCVEWLLREWQPPMPSHGHADRLPRLLEPCVGRGAIIEACNDAGLRAEWHACEHDVATFHEFLTRGLCLPTRASCLDFLVSTMYSARQIDCVLTNPPYSLAEEFVKKSLEIAPVVVMLLRLNFLGSQKRSAFLRDNPPDVYVLSRRPSFTNGGTDSTEYAWFVWDRRARRRSGSIMVLTEPEVKP